MSQKTRSRSSKKATTRAAAPKTGAAAARRVVHRLSATERARIGGMQEVLAVLQQGFNAAHQHYQGELARIATRAGVSLETSAFDQQTLEFVAREG